MKKQRGRPPKQFLWVDKTGRGFTNNFNATELKKAFTGERDDNGQTIAWYALLAEVGDEFRNSANKIIRTQ